MERGKCTGKHRVHKRPIFETLSRLGNVSNSSHIFQACLLLCDTEQVTDNKRMKRRQGFQTKDIAAVVAPLL